MIYVTIPTAGVWRAAFDPTDTAQVNDAVKLLTNALKAQW